QHQTKDFTSVEDSLCNLRVMLESYSTGEMRTLFFFSVKKAVGQPVAQRKWRRQTCSRIASRR
ncbi:hypothetical protein, partial [Ruminococcus callidus]